MAASSSAFVDPNPDSVPTDLIPVEVHLEKGKEYFWCKCGLTKTPPFCDGSHRAEGKIKPVKFTATATGPVWLCQCKGTSDPTGLCDGTHNAGKDVYLKKYSTKLLKANSALQQSNEALAKQLSNLRVGALVAATVLTTALFAVLKLGK